MLNIKKLLMNSVEYKTKKVLGINVADITLKNIASAITDLINGSEKVTVFGANSHAINTYQKDIDLKKAFDNATLIYPEGAGTVLASKILGNPLGQKTTLMDFILRFLGICEEKKWSVYVLGGREEISQKALNNLKNKFTNLKIYGHHGYFSKNETKQILADINKVKPKILFVAMGTPMQEVWIDRYKGKIEAKAFFGIGGSIDIIAGVVPRAPKIMTSNGFEWLYRFYKEPGRLWKRYLIGNVEFTFRILIHTFQ